jgi:hypothetical protein
MSHPKWRTQFEHVKKPPLGGSLLKNGGLYGQANNSFMDNNFCATSKIRIFLSIAILRIA